MTIPATVNEAARRLEVSPDSIRRWVDAGTLAAVKTESGQRLIDREALEALVAERQQARQTR
jgi:excisionase family DNA binding protein